MFASVVRCTKVFGLGQSLGLSGIYQTGIGHVSNPCTGSPTRPSDADDIARYCIPNVIITQE